MLQLATITTQSFDSSGRVSDVQLKIKRKQEDGVCKELKLLLIHLLSLYPNCYKEKYSLKSAYYQLITNTQRVSKVGILAKAGAWEFKSAWRRRSSACQVAGPMQPDLKA